MNTTAHDAMREFDKPASRIQDGEAGRAIEIQEMHGGKPGAVVTGITKPVVCHYCQGDGIGYVDGETSMACHVCQGTGIEPSKGFNRNRFQYDTGRLSGFRDSVPTGSGVDCDEFWSGQE